MNDAPFEEDRTRSRNLRLNGNLAVLRCVLIALKTRLPPESCAQRVPRPFLVPFQASFTQNFDLIPAKVPPYSPPSPSVSSLSNCVTNDPFV